MNDMSTTFDHTAAIVLAAGKGSRMNAKTKNKVAFKLSGQPMISYTVKHILESGINQIIAVVGYQADSVKAALGDQVVYATQAQQQGTGDAIKSAIPFIPPHVKTVLTVYGDDSAFYPPELFTEMVNKKDLLGCDVLFLTIHKDDPTGLGRIVRDENNKVVRIVEEKSATDEEKKIQEINTGFYCFNRSFLEEYISHIQKDPISGEYYLTDMIEIALKNGKKVEALFIKDGAIWQGINNRRDLARVKSIKLKP
jgi:bifunctional UDP-N-acetylglucosamine pyrophosphorylase/glucosamine-1-phosphate N-acetyltransferase